MGKAITNHKKTQRLNIENVGALKTLEHWNHEIENREEAVIIGVVQKLCSVAALGALMCVQEQGIVSMRAWKRQIHLYMKDRRSQTGAFLLNDA